MEPAQRFVLNLRLLRVSIGTRCPRVSHLINIYFKFYNDSYDNWFIVIISPVVFLITGQLNKNTVFFKFSDLSKF